MVASLCESADDDRITNSNNTTDDAADANIIDVVAKQQQPPLAVVMKAAALILFSTATAVRGAAIELTPSNFDKEVFAPGRHGAFVKFLAPW